MSVNKYWREAWIQKVYGEAVSLFHETRETDEEKNTPLADLARKCANTVFAEAAPLIVGDKEATAKAFMAYCRSHFGEEINKAIAERARRSVTEHQHQQEARVS